MDKITIQNIILFFFFLFITNKISAQIDFDDDKRNVYWFYVKISLHKDTASYYHYDLKRKRKNIQEGLIKDFDRSLWKYLSKGSTLAIGPFSQYADVKTSYSLYTKDESSQIKDSVLNSTQTVYWFAWKIKKNERTNPPFISRLPIATASGSFNDFKVFLEENLSMRILTIGPFKSEEEAELAKRMYRLNNNY